jgi:uncharacterized Zn-binding protein involved in type VI secretion
MPNVARLGDVNAVGGAIMRGAFTVMIEGKPAGLHPSQITPHAPYGQAHPPHAAAVTTTGSVTVMVEGSPLLLLGSGTTCGHPIVQGAFTVQAI